LIGTLLINNVVSVLLAGNEWRWKCNN